MLAKSSYLYDTMLDSVEPDRIPGFTAAARPPSIDYRAPG
jgi:hypothetical protein